MGTIFPNSHHHQFESIRSHNF